MLKDQYHSEFLSFKQELKSFVFRLVTNVQDAEDIVHDTYLKAFDKLEKFEGRSSFKTWVFAIALNHAKNYLTKQKPWLVDTQTIAANLHLQTKPLADKVVKKYESKPEQAYEVKEHINYCFNCMTKTLEIHQQVCLWLKEVYGFKIEEIMRITALSEGKVKHAIADARKTMIDIFEQKCALVSKKGVCHQCTQLAGFLNAKEDAHKKALKIKMVKEGMTPDKERLLDLRLELARDIDPLLASNAHIHLYFLENNPKWVEIGLSQQASEKN